MRRSGRQGQGVALRQRAKESCLLCVELSFVSLAMPLGDSLGIGGHGGWERGEMHQMGYGAK